MTELVDYDPARWQVDIGGSILSGVAAGTFINLTRTQENYKWGGVSPDGSLSARVKTNDRSAAFTFTLHQGSPWNALISNLAARDEAQGDGVVPVTITDLLNPEAVYFAEKAYVEKPADLVRADSIQGQAWLLRMVSVVMRHMGSNPTAALTAALA